MDGRPFAKNFVMGSLQVGQGGLFKRTFPILVAVVFFTCFVYWLQTRCWFLQRCVFSQASCRQRRGLPPRRVC